MSRHHLVFFKVNLYIFLIMHCHSCHAEMTITALSSLYPSNMCTQTLFICSFVALMVTEVPLQAAHVCVHWCCRSRDKPSAAAGSENLSSHHSTTSVYSVSAPLNCPLDKFNTHGRNCPPLVLNGVQPLYIGVPIKG